MIQIIILIQIRTLFAILHLHLSLASTLCNLPKVRLQSKPQVVKVIISNLSAFIWFFESKLSSIFRGWGAPVKQ